MKDSCISPLRFRSRISCSRNSSAHVLAATPVAISRKRASAAVPSTFSRATFEAPGRLYLLLGALAVAVPVVFGVLVLLFLVLVPTVLVLLVVIVAVVVSAVVVVTCDGCGPGVPCLVFHCVGPALALHSFCLTNLSPPPPST